MAAPITNASDLNSKRVRREVYREMVHENTLKFLMGTDENASIQVKRQDKKAGDTIVFPFLNALSNDYKVGNQQLQGNTEDLDFQSDTVVVKVVRYGSKVEEADISEQRAEFEVFNQMRPQLVTRGAEIQRDNIIDAIGDVTEGRSQNRYLYGAADTNWDATHATALANIDTTNDKMTTSILSIVKEKADLGGNTSGVTKSHKIRPFKMMMDNGAISSIYVALLHPTAAKQLRADSDYKNLALYRSEATAPKLVDGSRFMGMFNGVMLYQVDELERLCNGSTPGGLFSYSRTDLTSAGATSSAVNHNVLLGAQAVAMGVAMEPEFRSESTDFGNIREAAFTEIYGVTKLVFNSVDNGVVHFFTSAG